MRYIFIHEFKMSIKSLFIWILCVAGMGFACIMMYSGMQGDMESMAESFSSMGAFSDAFGMSQLSIGTLIGFYATEIGTIHGLGGAMFAAIISTVMLSKEEDGHTGEFLYSLPVSREKVVWAKIMTLVSDIVAFNIICVLVYMFGFILLGEDIPYKEFFTFHIMQLILQLEIAAICFAISAFMKRNKWGVGIGVALLLYGYDILSRISPKMSDYKLVSPFSYANAAEILSGENIYVSALILGIIVCLICVITSIMVYSKRDLSS